MRKLFRDGNAWLVVALFGTILLLILPVAPLVLDILLTISIALSLVTLLVVLYLRTPAEFPGFPALLLFITLYRLAINIASTRLVLLDGYAGRIIQAFGKFAGSGNHVAGMVAFFVLILINFIVITKGAGRIALVAARVTLDALPGKQMAINAELSAGLITETEAHDRRRATKKEGEFYGALEGASKFVRGDAIAAIFIILINVVGGIAIGVLQKHLTMGEALQRYTILAIGDGLACQIPALITSTAACLLVFRASSRNNHGQDLGRQLLFYPRALTILSAVMAVIALLPGMPTTPFLAIAVIVGMLSLAMHHNRPREIAPPTDAPTADPAHETNLPPVALPSAPIDILDADAFEDLLDLDTLQVELGSGLVTLTDKEMGGDLRDCVTGVRRDFAREMGVLVPPIRLRENLQLGANEYRFLLRGQVVAQGQLMPGHWLVMRTNNIKTDLDGIPSVEPVFQTPGTWITDADRASAEAAGCTVADAASVLVTNLSESIRRRCHEILTRQDVQGLLDHLKKTHPAVVNELVPAQLTVGQVQRILQNLLAEGISIRNLAGILEKISDSAPITKNPDELSEYARRALSPQIIRPYQSDAGRLRAITIDPRLEQQLAKGVRQSTSEVALVIEPKLALHLMDALSKFVQQMLSAGQQPVVLCAPQLRLAFRRFFESTFIDLPVLSYSDIPARVQVQNAAVIQPPE